MANIITAGNSTNGGTSVATDTSGTLEIKTGTGSGTTAISIDASQNVTIAGTLNAGAITNTTGSFSGNLSFNSGYGSAAVAYGCRAWVNFNGTGTPAIRASGNVSSITDNGTGDYTVNFTTAMPDVNYCHNVSASFSETASGFNNRMSGSCVKSTGSLRIPIGYVSNITGALGAEDIASVQVAIFR